MGRIGWIALFCGSAQERQECWLFDPGPRAGKRPFVYIRLRCEEMPNDYLEAAGLDDGAASLENSVDRIDGWYRGSFCSASLHRGGWFEEDEAVGGLSELFNLGASSKDGSDQFGYVHGVAACVVDPPLAKDGVVHCCDEPIV